MNEASTHGTETIYQCPKTGEPLLQSGDRLHTASGDSSYPIVNGIPMMCVYPSAEGDEGDDSMNKLVAAAADLGWQEAIEKNWPEVARYVIDTTRHQMVDLLPLKPDHKILEVGGGLGQFTVPMAKRVKELYAIDVVQGQSEFTKIRCEQSGCDNVIAASGGDNLKVPYRDNSFDGVILNLVVEWCACRDTTMSFQQGQMVFLEECCRVLKDGGYVYICTKNRYSLKCLMGRGDEHTNLTFGNALPRWLMDKQLKKSGKDRPNGLLHSHNWWRRTLGKLGFGQIQSYWAAPEMRFPDRYIPLDSASVRAARREGGFRQGDQRSSQWVMPWIPAPLVKHFTRGHCFLAFKNDSENK